MVNTILQRTRTTWPIVCAVLLGVGLVAVVGWLLYKSIPVIIMLGIAGMVALVLNPLVEALSRRMKRWLAIGLVYLAIVGAVTLAALLLIPMLVHQGKEFATTIPSIYAGIHTRMDGYVQWYQFQTTPAVHELIDRGIEQARNGSKMALDNLVPPFFSTAVATITWTVRVFIILVMSIYILFDKDNLSSWLQRVTPAGSREQLNRLGSDLLGVLGGYLRGLAIMVLFVASVVSLMLLVCHIHYWLFIGVMAGLFEVIPYFGAVAGAIPAVFLGFQNSTGMGIGLIIGFIVINQIEGHLVAPNAYGHTMHMRPLTVLLALLVGAEVAHVVGMIVAVPMLGALRVLWAHWERYFKESAPSQDGDIILPTAHTDPSRSAPVVGSSPAAAA